MAGSRRASGKCRNTRITIVARRLDRFVRAEEQVEEMTRGADPDHARLIDRS